MDSPLTDRLNRRVHARRVDRLQRVAMGTFIAIVVVWALIELIRGAV